MKKATQKATAIVLKIKKEARNLDLNNVGVAISGGPDSVALLYVLKEARIQTVAFHCNFHLRGWESDRDCDLVKQLCEEWRIPLVVKDFDITSYLEENKGISLEMACRELRYSWFFSELEARGLQRIATGHNANDNVETFFLNMLRGSGTAGLKGMKGDNGKIWRPLIDFQRSEIMELICECNIPYAIDHTNLESDFRRNYLRNEIIPLLRKEWKGFDKAIKSTIGHIADENKIIEDAIAKNLPDKGNPLCAETIFSFPAPLLLIRRFIDPVLPFTTTASEILESFRADKPSAKFWKVRKGIIKLKNQKLYILPDINPDTL